MRIGLVTGEYPPMQGGVGDFSQRIAAALAELGHETHAITHASVAAYHGIPGGGVRVHARVKQWGLSSLVAVPRLARSLSLDVLNIQYQAAAFGMGLPIHFLPRAAPLPAVVTFHDLRVPYLFPKAGRLRRQAVLYLARCAAGVIVTNAEDRLALERAGRIPKAAEIPIGSNVDPSPPPGYSRADWRRSRGLPEPAAGGQSSPAGPLVGYFGFLNASKGGEALIRALADLPEARLLLIGGRSGTSDPTNAAYADQVDALASELGVSGRIHRTGFLPPGETSAALLACDMMAMPYIDGASFRRGTFVACLAHGLPTVTTQPNVPLPQLKDGENIRLVPRQDPAALASALRDLWADAGLRARLSAGAAALADEFTWDKIAARTASFFEEVLARGPSGGAGA